MKVVLTSKGDWGVVPGERVATISGEEDDVNSAIEELLAVIAVCFVLHIKYRKVFNQIQNRQKQAFKKTAILHQAALLTANFV